MPDSRPAADASGDELLRRASEFSGNLLNFFWRQGVSLSEGEDLVQETLLRLWNYRDRYSGKDAKLSTFLFILARQVRIDALRRRARRENRDRAWGEERGSSQPPAEACAADDALWALSRLPEPHREVVELGLMQDLPYAEVSAILGIPVGTVKSRMSNAMKKLKEIVDERGH